MNADRDRGPYFLCCSFLLAAALFLAPEPIASQTQGRVQITTIDQSEQPIEGATVVLELIGDRDLRLESKTNKRGRVLFALQDATYSFDVKVVAEGFQPVTSRIKPKVNDVARSKFVLERLDSRPGAGERGSEAGTVSYTPAETAHNEGVLALRRGDDALALERFQQALRLDHQLAVSRSALAGLYLGRQDYQQAIGEAERLLLLEPKSVRANRILYDVGQATGDSKLVARAEKELEAAGALSSNPAVKYNQGAEALSLGDMKTARARFEEALELAPELLVALSGMTMVEANEGNHRQAMALAARILAVDPRNLRALRARFNAAVALSDQTEIDLALEALAKEDPDALVGQLFERAISSFNQNQLETAKEELERVLQLAEDHPSAHYYLGLCLVNLGDEQQAREHFRRFLDLDPSSQDAEVARQMLDHLR